MGDNVKKQLVKRENLISVVVTAVCVVLLVAMLVVFLVVRGMRDAEQSAPPGDATQSEAVSDDGSAAGSSVPPDSQSAASSSSAASAEVELGTDPESDEGPELGSEAKTESESESESGSGSGSGSEPESESKAEPGQESEQESGQASGSAASKPTATSTGNKRVELEKLIGKDRTQKLIDRVRTDRDTLWVAAHPEEFASDGEEVQVKILKLAADEQAAVPFVRGYPESYPAEKPSKNSSIAMDIASPSSKVPSTNIPHLYQWDRRWGYTVYDGGSFGLGGCGPTSLAMVYQGLTGKTDLSPYDIGQVALEWGYVIEGQGTMNDLFVDAAPQLGLLCEMVYPDAEAIRQTLADGKPIIANVGVGRFTDYGHFFVLAGVSENGKIIINDPYSVERSSQTWDPALIASESLALYAYSAIEVEGGM